MYVYKDLITETFLKYLTKLQINKEYNYLYYKNNLTNHEKNKYYIYNLKLINVLNLKFKKYLNVIDYRTLKIILIPMYKELFKI